VFHLVVNTEKRKVTVNHAFLLFKSKPVRVHEILSSLWQVNFALTLVMARINGVLKEQIQRSTYRAHTYIFFPLSKELFHSGNSGYGNSVLVLGDATMCSSEAM
jgi:hypothetical protein